MTDTFKSPYPHIHHVQRKTSGDYRPLPADRQPELEGADVETQVFGWRYARCPGCCYHALSGEHDRACCFDQDRRLKRGHT